MKYKYVVWDWNGTLFDDVQICIKAMNKLLEVKGYNHRLDFNKYQDIFGFPIINYYKAAGIDFDKHPFDEVAELFIDIYSSMPEETLLFPGAVNMLDYMRAKGVTQLVISACEKTRLLEQIHSFGIDGYFDFILGIDDNYASSKVDIAKKWFADNQINPKDAVFIGDTMHDFEVAKSVGCNAILIAAGHQSRERLKTAEAAVLDRLEDLNKLF